MYHEIHPIPVIQLLLNSQECRFHIHFSSQHMIDELKLTVFSGKRSILWMYGIFLCTVLNYHPKLILIICICEWIYLLTMLNILIILISLNQVSGFTKTDGMLDMVIRLV